MGLITRGGLVSVELITRGAFVSVGLITRGELVSVGLVTFFAHLINNVLNTH